ncbi:hypothetical protein [uncultured Methanobrevibacter sp.]|uniref:hypothetical protein n=1 Tax=uncultured Methanobrevibacter sp. TaxID=253161 RepID=UPI0025DE7C0E|nr:hypothetical protein [uncultured Methanobrevibacter sp.]
MDNENFNSLKNSSNQNNSSNIVSKKLEDFSDCKIISEEVKFNLQNEEGQYRLIRYEDGGFRQFDVETDELIGSSYKSDQEYLPSME